LNDSTVRVREAKAEDFAGVQALLLGFDTPAVTAEAWRQLFVDHSGAQNGVFGYVMTAGDPIVGFIATTIGERTIRGRSYRLCNVSNWIVAEAYRGRSMDLLAKVLEPSETTITVLSPAPHVLRIFKLLGFETLDTSERIILPSPLPSRSGKVTVLTDAPQIEQGLGAEERAIFRHHSLPHNKHLLLRDGEGGDCYVLMNRSWKTVAGRIRVPMGRVHHMSSRDVFVRHADRIVSAAATHFGVAALVVNERALGGRRIWHSLARPGGPRTGAFRSGGLRPEDIDGLYSEAVLLNY
jgi:hypothetical protein